MKVAVDATLLGGQHSGVHNAIEGMITGLSEVAPGADVLVIHTPAYRPAWQGPVRLETHCAPAWTRGRAGRVAWMHWRLPEVAHQWRADVLHAPGYVGPKGWRGPMVLTVYDVFALSHPEWSKWANVVHYRWALPDSVRRARVVVVPSEFVRREVVARLGVNPERVRVVMLGISAAMTPAKQEAVEAVRRRYGLSGPYLLFVGNLEPKKNVEGIVRGFELAAGRIPHDLVVAGKPAWKCGRALQAMRNSPFRSRIRELSYVCAEELPALYSGADLLVHWARCEGWGLTPVEAMACGTPAVVSDGGALPEVAGQVAPVVPLGDPAELADAIVELLGDEQRRLALRQRGLEWARQFTWRRHAECLLPLYEEAAQGALIGAA